MQGYLHLIIGDPTLGTQAPGLTAKQISPRGDHAASTRAKPLVDWCTRLVPAHCIGQREMDDTVDNFEQAMLAVYTGLGSVAYVTLTLVIHTVIFRRCTRCVSKLYQT